MTVIPRQDVNSSQLGLFHIHIIKYPFCWSHTYVHAHPHQITRWLIPSPKKFPQCRHIPWSHDRDLSTTRQTPTLARNLYTAKVAAAPDMAITNSARNRLTQPSIRQTLALHFPTPTWIQAYQKPPDQWRGEQPQLLPTCPGWLRQLEDALGCASAPRVASFSTCSIGLQS